MIDIGIDPAETFSTDQFFPVYFSLIIIELGMPFFWYLSSFLVEWHGELYDFVL